MVALKVAVNLGETREILTALIKEAGEPRGLLEVTGAVLENSIRSRFQTGTAPGGVPWPPSQRVLKGGGGRTLIDKGGLVNSITYRADDKQMEVGVIAKTRSAKFAHVHQFGATIRPKKKGGKLVFKGADGHLVFANSVRIPARPFIGIDETDREDLVDAWRAQLERAVK